MIYIFFPYDHISFLIFQHESDFVMWNDRIDTISNSGLWAHREPSTSKKMCVKIALTHMRNRLTGTLDKLGRLHSEACPKKLPVVCEKPSLE